MITLEGQILHVYETPKGTTKEGDDFGGKAKVELIGRLHLRNGESRHELIPLTVDDPAPFKDAIGHQVRVPVGAFAKGSNLIWYHAKASPEPLVLV